MLLLQRRKQAGNGISQRHYLRLKNSKKDKKVSKNSKYQTHKKRIKLTKNPNDRTAAPGGTLSDFSTSVAAKHQKN